MLLDFVQSLTHLVKCNNKSSDVDSSTVNANLNVVIPDDIAFVA